MPVFLLEVRGKCGGNGRQGSVRVKQSRCCPGQ